MILPIWARKPKHKQEVVATSRGWEVKATGELLVSSRGLDEKLKALAEEIEDLDTTSVVSGGDEPVTQTTEPDQEPSVVEPEQDDDESEKQEESKPDQEKTDEKSEVNKTEEKPKPKRRGRPKKNANTTSNTN